MSRPSFTCLLLVTCTTLAACGDGGVPAHDTTHDDAPRIDAAGQPGSAEPSVIETSTRSVHVVAIVGAVDDARLEARRVDDSGRRVIEHWDGRSRAAFIDDPGLMPVDAYGIVGQGATLVCSHVNAGRDGLALSIHCGVRQSGVDTFARVVIAGAPSAWLHDACWDERGGASLRVSLGRTPFPETVDHIDRALEPACSEHRWTEDAGWFDAGPAPCKCGM